MEDEAENNDVLGGSRDVVCWYGQRQWTTPENFLELKDLGGHRITLA